MHYFRLVKMIEHIICHSALISWLVSGIFCGAMVLVIDTRQVPIFIALKMVFYLRSRGIPQRYARSIGQLRLGYTARERHSPGLRPVRESRGRGGTQPRPIAF